MICEWAASDGCVESRVLKVCDYCMQRVHGSLLQRSHQMIDADRSRMMDMSQLPLALREAAFFESADCYTAMIANREVGYRQPQERNSTEHVTLVIAACGNPIPRTLARNRVFG
jgi:hypothetical protein